MTVGARYRFRAPLWEWEARENWFFVSLPADASEEIAELPFPPRGFGAVAVRATVGVSQWSTSIFPGADGLFVLPIRKAVRMQNAIDRDDTIDVEVELAD